MLLPVGAVSVVGAPVGKPVVATAETAGLQTTATPLAVLSSTINTSVEGKLNMLLATARVLGATLLTKDTQLLQYSLQRHVRALEA